MMLGDSTLKSLTPSVNTSLVHRLQTLVILELSLKSADWGWKHTLWNEGIAW